MPALSRRSSQTLLALLLLLFLGWDLVTILRDQRLGPTDTTLLDYLLLDTHHQGLVSWIQGAGRKGPLAALLIHPLRLLIGDALIAARVLGVLLHGVTLVLVFGLAARLTRSRGAGLLAVVACATVPMQYGWFRLDYHDSLVAVALMAVIWLLLLEGLDRWTSGLKLGLTVALGLVSKLSFPIFVLLPGILFLATRVRGRRQLLHLGLALAIAVAIPLLWLVPNWEAILVNLARSRHSIDDEPLEKLGYYLVRMPGSLPFLTAAGLGALAAWWRRGVSRWALAMLLSCIVGSVLMLGVLFDPWSRYLLPIYPPGGVLVGCGLAALARWAGPRLGRRPLRALALLLVAGLLGQYVWFNLRGLSLEGEQREHGVGMVSADRQDYTAFPGAVIYLRQGGFQSLLMFTDRYFDSHSTQLAWYWEQRGYSFPLQTAAEARQRQAAGEPIYVVYGFDRSEQSKVISHGPLVFPYRTVRELGAWKLPREGQTELTAWLARQRYDVVRNLSDPGGGLFAVVRLSPRGKESPPRGGR